MLPDRLTVTAGQPGGSCLALDSWEAAGSSGSSLLLSPLVSQPLWATRWAERGADGPTDTRGGLGLTGGGMRLGLKAEASWGVFGRLGLKAADSRMPLPMGLLI